MTHATELSTNVNVGLNIDKRTAETCLHLVQLYINSHSGMFVAEKRKENGEIEYIIEEWRKP